MAHNVIGRWALSDVMWSAFSCEQEEVVGDQAEKEPDEDDDEGARAC